MADPENPSAALDARRPEDGDDTRRFETLVEELETIVERLERGNLTLADSLEAFERGTALTRRADAVLTRAEQRVELLLEANDGSLRTAPLDPEG